MRDLVAVLAEPNRRRLLELLLGGERTVTELASQFPVTRSAVSQHLGVLAEAGLVLVRKEGRYRYYRVVPEGLERLRASLDVFWTRELQELAAGHRAPRAGGANVTVEKSVLVPVDPDAVFAMLTEPERLRRWQTVTARIDLRAGGDYRWTITPAHSAAGTVVEVEPGRRLVLTWGWEDSEDLPPGASTLTVTLEPAEGGTLVRLVHEGLTEQQAEGHGQGWDHYLARLALAVAGDAGADPWSAAPDPLDGLAAAEATAAICLRVLRGVGEGDGALPTPCARFDVDGLVGHLLGSIRSLGEMAGAAVTVPEVGTAEDRVGTASQQALEAWRRRGTDGDVRSGANPLPAPMAVDILSLEYMVHAWDLARATGQRVEVDDALSVYVLEVAKRTVVPRMRDGEQFAAEVEIGADAGALGHLVAFTGRTP